MARRIRPSTSGLGPMWGNSKDQGLFVVPERLIRSFRASVMQGA